MPRYGLNVSKNLLHINPIKNNSLWHTKAYIRGHLWHLLPWCYNWQLTYRPLENYSILYVVVCWPQWIPIFKVINYQLAATGHLPQCQQAKCYARADPALHHRQCSNWLDVTGKLMARRNAMNNTWVMPVASTCATVIDTDSAADNFLLGSI